MKFFVAVVVFAVVAAIIVIMMQGCTVQQKYNKTEVMNADSNAEIRIHCYMGHIKDIDVLADGAGHFHFDIDKDECDGNDRT
jgi:uncharacterized alpha/beta hydrolase family protein